MSMMKEFLSRKTDDNFLDWYMSNNVSNVVDYDEDLDFHSDGVRALKSLDDVLNDERILESDELFNILEDLKTILSPGELVMYVSEGFR